MNFNHHKKYIFSFVSLAVAFLGFAQENADTNLKNTQESANVISNNKDMCVEDCFGDLKKIDIEYSLPEEDAAVMVLVTVGYIDGTKEMQTALMDKMEGYLKHAQSEAFKKDYPQSNVILEIDFQEIPHRLIIQLLGKTMDWCESCGVAQRVKIGERFMSITKDEKGDYYYRWTEE